MKNRYTFKITIVYKNEIKLEVENYTRILTDMQSAINSSIEQLYAENETDIEIIEIHATKVTI